jgi:hypothetical protein
VGGQSEGLEVPVDDPVARVVPAAREQRRQQQRSHAHHRGARRALPQVHDDDARGACRDGYEAGGLRECGQSAREPGQRRSERRGAGGGARRAGQAEDRKRGEQRHQEFLVHHGAHVDVRGEEEQETPGQQRPLRIGWSRSAHQRDGQRHDRQTEERVEQRQQDGPHPERAQHGRREVEVERRVRGGPRGVRIGEAPALGQCVDVLPVVAGVEAPVRRKAQGVAGAHSDTDQAGGGSCEHGP